MTNNKIVQAGNTGEKVRSDCFISLEITDKGGIEIKLKSKVKTLYGKDIIKLTNDIFNFFGVENAKIEIDDSGAIPLVLAARIEFAIKEFIETEEEFLLPVIEETKYQTKKEKFRFSRLYLPGNTPSMMLNAGIHKPNGIILDLEDAVAYSKKTEARYMVRNALRGINFYGAEKMVRINQYPAGIEDLKYIVPHGVHLILVPKCESATQIHKIEEVIQEIKKENNINHEILLMPIVESALGIEKCYEIACSSENVVAMAIGLEDFTADLGVKRTSEGKESLYARTRLINACKAAGIQPIDSVFSDVSDMEALALNVEISKNLGFEGMGCIHPRQIKVIHENFAPSTEEINKAKRIVHAFNKAEAEGLGVVSLGTKMIDAPVVKRAQTTIMLATSLGLLEENGAEL